MKSQRGDAAAAVWKWRRPQDRNLSPRGPERPAGSLFMFYLVSSVV